MSIGNEAGGFAAKNVKAEAINASGASSRQCASPSPQRCIWRPALTQASGIVSAETMCQSV